MPEIDTADTRVKGLPSAAGEISLTEIWLIIAKRRVLVVSIIGLCTLAGLAIGLTRSERFPVSIAIDIGSAGADGQPTPIEPPRDTVAKLKESYIPNLLAAKPELVELGIVAETPANTRIVKVNATAKSSKTAEASAVLTRLADSIVEEHETTIAPYRAQLASRIGLLEHQTQQLNTDLEGLEVERHKLQNALVNSVGVDAVSTGLAHVEVERIIASTRNALARVQTELDGAQKQWLASRSSRTLSSAVVSRQPTGAGVGVIVLLSLLAGAVAALVAALFSEFVARTS